ncbi:Aldolase-type TIM barrel [Metarhizium album ARSEF 1941]|uniref:Dihydroorotate dehydrogenase (fumarate) n=1 Tax=Metarhizium album (strain ARSEF 1941) TaxID=1081103 RepID=A0A0B2WKK4_METAS|nr:Aldolase-type TIM barrel [Metarhizium album ARSEF 1941]KHN94012.1 Aldolase-type TIM barrel [Metarhizium album ARSEF 1941]
MAPRLSIHPPLLNTACPWATTPDHLESLLKCPSTGAITTRTSLIQGFAHDDAVHQYALFDPVSNTAHQGTPSPSPAPVGSINSFGYSPLPLDTYLAALQHLSAALPNVCKPAIISVAGPPPSVAACYASIMAASPRITFPLAMEINLSCPNIPGRPPPAYDPASLTAYLSALPQEPLIPVGVKTPPYTYSAQFTSLADALEPYASRISFVTATNTLGSCVVSHADGQDALPGGTGGMAGVAIHPLSVGNVRALTRLLSERGLDGVDVIGAGGVHDGASYRRMRSAGAKAVGLATALASRGVGVFEDIERLLDSEW